jgi:hypothetical protein
MWQTACINIEVEWIIVPNDIHNTNSNEDKLQSRAMRKTDTRSDQRTEGIQQQQKNDHQQQKHNAKIE